MEKNTIWAISLSTVVLVGFFAAQTILFPNQNVKRNQPVQENNQTEEAQSVAESSVPAETVKTVFKTQEAVEAKEEEFTVTTDKVKVTFTNRGGDVIGYELIEKDSKGNLKNLDRDTGKGIEMVDNVNEKNRAFALSFGGYKNGIINDIFNVQRIDDYTIGFYKTYVTENEDGTSDSFTLVKTYSFKQDDYLFKLDITVDADKPVKQLSDGTAAYTLRTAPQIGPHFDSKNNRYENRQFVSYNGSKAKKIILGTKQSKEYEKEWNWAALAGKYFEMIVFPVDSSIMNSTVNYSSNIEVNDYANAQVKVERKAITNKETNDSYYIYAGPRNEKELKKYNLADNNSWKISGAHFDDSLNTSGFLSWLEVILKFFLESINKLVSNWGVSIIVLTILLKIALFPITKKSLEGTQKMQKYQPKMQELQAKYKGDPQKLQMETAKMYKEIGYNPMSGCLPLLFQFVILFAMYNLFNNYFEFRGAAFVEGWIDDLSAGDHIGKPFASALPILGWNQIRILPVIYVVSQLLFGKITNNGGASMGQNAGQMKMMMYGMPILFFFLFYNAPSGLLLYWTVSNIVQLIQQLLINRIMKNKNTEIKPVKTNKNKR
ncbi:MAG: membrane protein insertase YidC [Treponema sp.]|nr:membrane protein insertase YidC [Candidatus Treponema equifaecale]